MNTPKTHSTNAQNGSFEDIDVSDLETRCGIGRVTSSFLQCFANPKIFISLLLPLILLMAAAVSYTGAVLTTIEKEFQLSSTESGFLTVISDITNVVFIMFLSFLGHSAHRPRWIGTGILLTGIGIFISSFPHFRKEILPLQTINNTFDIPDYCINANGIEQSKVDTSMLPEGFDYSTLPSIDSPALNNTENICETLETNFGSTIWLIIGFFLHGLGSAVAVPLIITYIDDSVPAYQTVFCIALLILATTLGAVVGFLVSALTLSLFVDFDRVESEYTVNLTQHDSRWVGAWWLGYTIIGTIVIIGSIPFFSFPRRMPARFKVSNAKEANVDDAFLQGIRTKPRSENKGVFNTVKRFFGVLSRLLLNPSLISLSIGSSAEVAVISIFVAFIIKYVVNQFGVTIGTIIVGAVISPCSMIGSLFGGWFCRRFKLGPKKTSLFIVCAATCSVCIIPALMFTGCSNSDVAGVTTGYRQTEQVFINNSSSVLHAKEEVARDPDLPNLKSVCNSECSCPEQMFLPVCGSDGVTYTSGCHAGCAHKKKSSEEEPTKYTECTCISDRDSEDGYGRAVLGACSMDCSTFPVYVILTAIMMTVTATKGSPLVYLVLRIVDDEDRSVAFGFYQLFTKVIGYFPAPIYFGAVINSVCLLWNKTCGIEGACLMYDIEKYRYSYFGLLLGLKLTSLTMFLIFYCTIRTKNVEESMSVIHEEPEISLPVLNAENITALEDDANLNKINY